MIITIGFKRFLCLVTGSEFLTLDPILLKFTSMEADPALSFHTCSKCIVLSTRIANTKDLKFEFSVLLQEKSFTMA